MEDVDHRRLQSTLPDLAGVGAGPLSNRSRSAIADLFKEHKGPLVQYVLRRFGPGPPEPEEVAQAAFARLSERDLSTVRDARGFLYAIACNFVIDHHRRQARRERAAEELAQHETLALSDPTPERVLLAREQINLLEGALRVMPAMRRRIFLMVRVEGLSPREVARAFGTTDNAVHKHVSRALADCAAALAESGLDLETIR